MQDAADLIKVSDLALYKAKAEGKNRTIQGTADDLLDAWPIPVFKTPTLPTGANW